MTDVSDSYFADNWHTMWILENETNLSRNIIFPIFKHFNSNIYVIYSNWVSIRILIDILRPFDFVINSNKKQSFHFDFIYRRTECQLFRYSVINYLVCGENSVARLNSVWKFFINIYGNKPNSMWMCTWIIIGNFVMVRSFLFCFRNFRIFMCDTQTEFEYLAYYIQWIWPNIWTHLSEINFLWVLNSIISVTRIARLSHSNEYCELIVFRFEPKWARK